MLGLKNDKHALVNSSYHGLIFLDREKETFIHDQHEPDLFRNDHDIPFFIRGKTDNLSFQNVLDILIQEREDKFLCKKQPLRVQQNAAFLVRTSCVKVEDLPFDDNGTYKSKGSHTWTFTLKETEQGKSVKELIGKRYIPRNDTSTVYLRRKYRTNISCEEFRQIVSYVEDCQGSILGGVALVQYNFTGVEKKFKVEAHDNKKDKTVPFFPTNVSTKQKIKDAVKTSKPMKVMASIAKTSSLITATSSASTPRDRTQIYNMKKQTREEERRENDIPDSKTRKDKIYSMMLMAYQEVDNGEENFIHGITAWPEAMCLLGYTFQFKDISRFCCSTEFYPLTIDTTFNLAEFYVTPTTYKNLLLQNVRDGKHPIFIGPTLVHMTRSYSAYCHLASKLKEVDPGIGDLRVSVTDGEPGLIKRGGYVSLMYKYIAVFHLFVYI